MSINYFPLWFRIEANQASANRYRRLPRFGLHRLSHACDFQVMSMMRKHHEPLLRLTKIQFVCLTCYTTTAHPSVKDIRTLYP